MTERIQMKCAICGDEWELSEKQYELEPFKICSNCRSIGLNEPGIYKIPKGRLVDAFHKNRDKITVSEEEMRRLYKEYYQQLDKVNGELRRRYSK